jgi:hypothetical protein
MSIPVRPSSGSKALPRQRVTRGRGGRVMTSSRSAMVEGC